MKINKKGFLLGEETIKIIITVICLVALVYFLISLYLAANRDKDLELAKASLEKLITDINAGREETEIYNPAGWGVISFSLTEQKPEFCINKGWSNCMCICKVNIEIHKTISSNCLDRTNKLMTCSESDFSINVGLGIGIGEKLPVFLSIDKQNKIITKKS